jgi:phosphoglycolate phosphatase-like HAD superfamily hydrolase
VGAELVIFDCDGVLVDSDRISLRIPFGAGATVFTAMAELPALVATSA